MDEVERAKLLIALAQQTYKEDYYEKEGILPFTRRENRDCDEASGECDQSD